MGTELPKKHFNQVQGIPVIPCVLDLDGKNLVSVELPAVPQKGERVYFPGNEYDRKLYIVRMVEHVIARYGTVEIIVRLGVPE